MRRRSFLTAVVAALAGCATTETDRTQSRTSTSTDSPETTSSERATPTPTESKIPTTALTTPEFEINQSVLEAPSVTSQQPIPWVKADIQNLSSLPRSRVRLQHRFYDMNDELLGARETYNAFIPAETTWRDYMRFYMEQPDQLDHVESRIVDQSVVTSAETDEFSVDNSNLDVSNEATVSVVGEINVSADFDYIAIIALVYSPEGFRGALSRSKQDVTAGDLVAFDAGTIGMRTPPNKAELPSRHEFRVFQGLV